MRHLFIRIFLPVFLVVLVTFGFGFTAARWLRSATPDSEPRVLDADARFGDARRGRAARGRRPGESMVREAERRIIACLQTGDVSGAQRHVSELNESRFTRAYLLDGHDVDSDGATLPQELRGIVDQAAAKGESLIAGSRSTRRIARLIPTTDHGEFIFAAEINGPGGRRPNRELILVTQIVAVAGALGIVSFFLARYITRPVLRLRAAVRQFAGGDMKQRIGPTFEGRRDEIAELGRDFDQMAERIADLLTTQRRLLRDVSHELRSPLTRQAVALEIVRRHISAEGEEALSRATLESERLNALIAELLTMARLESREEEVKLVPVALDQLVHQVIDDVGFEAGDSCCTTHLEQCCPCTVAGDPELLRRAVENVFRNAAAYTPEGTAVEVALTVVAGGAKLCVRDHGPGVPTESLVEIFRPFYRVGEGRDRKSGGTGLGLAIVARAIHSHGGSVAATNHADGGLIVEIRLPLNSGVEG